jgi:kexin
MLLNAKWILLSSVVVLAACGGGGGGSGGPAPVTQYGGLLGSDPLFGDQWHLYNQGQFIGVTPGEDINVMPVWNAGSGGQGVVVAVVDDGLEIAHPDLSANVSTTLNHNYQNNTNNPTPSIPTNGHGTAVAGLIAASAGNDKGGRGAAPRATLVGYNPIWTNFPPTTDIYDAMTRNAAVIAISSNSWGTASDGGEAAPPADTSWRDGITYGIANGRGGKGIIYVWAAGNGGVNNVDNSNYDYQTNDRHVIAVCAVSEQGKKTNYSEKGANLLVCAPGGAGVGLTTTDITDVGGYNAGGGSDYADKGYTGTFAGTSAATPLVSGVVALMLEANPNLGWRDVPLILAQSARKNDLNDADLDWKLTVPKAGQPQYHINHKYGFGVADANAAVNLAKTWVNVGVEQMVSGSDSPGSQILNDGSVVSSTVSIGSDVIVERVEVEFTSQHPYPGDLEIVLVAPSGTKSVLAENHTCYDQSNNPLSGACAYQYNPWIFTSVRHMGESSSGGWRLEVADRNPANGVGSLQSWRLRIYGRAN